MQNLDDLIKNKEYYQIQLNNNEYIIKKVGYGSEIGDIIILENFGCDKKYTLYACVYEKEELELMDYIPVVRLTDEIHNYCICFKSNKLIYNEIDTNFELYFMHGIKKKSIFKLDKNINSKNIIEIIIGKLIDFGIYIF
jgi:hypothetical protein